jgi:hypothetical protein
VALHSRGQIPAGGQHAQADEHRDASEDDRARRADGVRRWARHASLAAPQQNATSAGSATRAARRAAAAGPGRGSAPSAIAPSIPPTGAPVNAHQRPPAPRGWWSEGPAVSSMWSAQGMGSPRCALVSL